MASIWLGVLVGVTLANAAEASGSPSHRSIPVDVMVCGRHSLYLFLRLQSYSVTYQDVANATPIRSTGSSLQEMLDASERLGAKVSVVKSDCRSPSDLPMPAIALLRRDSSPIVDPGHFVVLLACDRDGHVEYLDGSFGFRKSISITEFQDVWSGYALVSGRRPVGEHIICYVIAGLVLLLVLSPFARKCRSESPRIPFNCATLLVMFFSLGHDATVLSAPVGETVSDLWRIPERDGINSLFVLSTLNGGTCSYEELLDSIPDHSRISLTELVLAAHRVGLRPAIVKGQLSAIIKLGRPVIAYIEDAGKQAGSFCVIVHIDETKQEVVYMTGDTAIVRRVSCDTFIRRWTGHALVLDSDSLLERWSLPCGVISVGVVLLAITRFRVRR